MKINKIYDYFDDTILRRGYDYYINNKIVMINKNKNTYIAKVKGKSIYDVLIDIEDNDIFMKCNCPYEDNCKHEAAVLYYLKHNKVSNMVLKYNDFENIKEFKKYLDTRYSEILISIDDNKAEYITNICNDTIKKISIKFTNKESFNFYIVLLDWLKEIELKFCYGLYLFHSDDKDFNYCDISVISDIVHNIINNYIYKLIKKDKKLLDTFINHYIRVYSNSNGNYDEVFYLFNCISNKDEYIQVKRYFNRLLDVSNNNNDIDIAINSLRFKYMSREDYFTYGIKNYKNSYVRDRLLYYCGKDNDLKVHYLKYFILNTDGYSVHNYIVELKDIVKNNNKYLDVLYDLFYESNNNIEYYYLIKDCFNKDEWINNRDKFIKNIKGEDYYLFEVYLSEGVVDKTFIYSKELGINVLFNYIEELYNLNKKLSDRLFKDKLINLINSNKYKDFTKYLGELYYIRNDKKFINELLGDVKKKYSKNKSLMNEINFFNDTYL